MDERLSSEALKTLDAWRTEKASNGSETTARGPSGRPLLLKRDSRSSMDKPQSETGSQLSAAGSKSNKIFRLKSKLQQFRTSSFSKSGSEAPVMKYYENTYRTEPKDGKQFSVPNAEQIIRYTLETYLKGKEYHPKRCAILSKSLAELIKERIKGSGIERYKLVSHVLIAENKGQSTRYVSRCLWSNEFDNYATATYETKDFIAIGSVFATYYD
ncbi:hypothetical protein CHS0354_041623 [Potamilus streckersoni]|uniref:Uncharacterized protein n=1 Tax=Potamilus streckersoni TaxID=2493646 RepID=A0AAE0SGH8_9BIVA|nr:hypothetical protein CHS0354_041623 [Potamilus streckersoni]